MNPLKLIDDFLNSITMYRLLTYGLACIGLLGIGFGITGVLSWSAPSLLLSLAILISVCYLTNRGIGQLWGAARSNESWLITALILFFVLHPATEPKYMLGIAATGVIAMASKYLLALHRKHFFNPAAFGAAAAGILGLIPSFWWVGSAVLLPFTLIFGLLILRKIRRWSLFLSFALISIVVNIMVSSLHDLSIFSQLQQLIVSSPLIFLGTVMLTEPATTPPYRRQQITYGALAGALFASQGHIGGLYFTPEVSLVLANIYAYIVSPKYKWQLRLKEKHQLSDKVYGLVFTSDKPMQFQAGQYMEWTLPHHGLDSRGNRRSFSIASSPTESDIHLGIKTYRPSSSFKRALLSLEPGQSLIAGQVSGNFVLPKDPAQKLVFIAGGIGITPFRSMVQYLIDTKQVRDITLFYVVSDPTEISYPEVWNEANAIGLKLVKVLSAKDTPPDWNGRVGPLTPDILIQNIGKYSDCKFYLSGPNGMVRAYRHSLHQMGVKNSHISTDYFSGY